ncbi:hypothetical protein FOZ61_000062 [Perkinsus olseni]|uniref:Glutamate decarboxylase 2 n=1 Tax=Perkinsus olseni TaxID=32597 RepID=A0A7J6MJS6_PEROL|nr:hypothetical protein FOZ61_000062 [Perkinsus olseni]KAF4675115.1 hypothetical protein FOL46_002702 [Perkinsus olseni]
MRRQLVDVREIRTCGNDTVDFVDRYARFLDQSARYSSEGCIIADEAIGGLKASGILPCNGRAWSQITAAIETSILPCLRAEKMRPPDPWNARQASVPAILSEALVYGMSAAGVQWASCPMHSSATDALLSIVTAARARKRVPIVVKSNELAVIPVENGSGIGRSEDISFEGLAMMTVYDSTESQLALKEACATAGITLREVPVKSDSSSNIRDLQEMIKEHKNQSCLPVLCVANLGTEYAGGSDSLAELGQICQKEGMWLHVDASFSAGTLLLDEYERDRGEMNEKSRSFSTQTQLTLADRHGFPQDWRWSFMAKGRQFRSLRVWSVLQYFGMNELRRNVQRRIASTGVIRRLIETDPQLNDDLAFPVWPARFGNLCFTSGSILPAAALDRLRERGITARYVGSHRGRQVHQAFMDETWSQPQHAVSDEQKPASAGERHSSFAEDGRLTIDFIARYFESLEGLAVRDMSLKPGSCATQDVEEFVVPGICHWQHPKFLAFFPAKISTPAIFSEVIAAALNRASADQNSDHSIEHVMEIAVMDALGEAFGLGEAFLHSSGRGGGLIHNTASDAILAIVAATRTSAQLKVALTGTAR